MILKALLENPVSGNVPCQSWRCMRLFWGCSEVVSICPVKMCVHNKLHLSMFFLGDMWILCFGYVYALLCVKSINNICMCHPIVSRRGTSSFRRIFSLDLSMSWPQTSWTKNCRNYSSKEEWKQKWETEHGNSANMPYYDRNTCQKLVKHETYGKKKHILRVLPTLKHDSDIYFLTYHLEVFLGSHLLSDIRIATRRAIQKKMRCPHRNQQKKTPVGKLETYRWTL